MNGMRVALVAGLTLLCVLTAGSLVLFGFRVAYPTRPVNPAPPPPPPRVRIVPPAPVPPPTPPRPALALESGVLDRVCGAAVFLQVKHVSYLDEKVEQESSGSGFFISPDGRIVTCWHVVHAQQEAPELIIPLKLHKLEAIVGSGTRRQLLFPARLIAADPKSDLAVLKIDYRPEAWLELGDSEALRRTTPVWVLGYPLGKVFSVLQRGPEYSINRGYVSSLRHDDLERLDRVQFDAAVTPGNSGGPVFGDDGKVLGVANIAFGTSRVNFAVPATKVREVLGQVPLELAADDACRIQITSEPTGAQVFWEGRELGVTPLEKTFASAYGLLECRMAGRRGWSKRLGIHDQLNVHAVLEPLDTRVLKTSENAGKLSADVKLLPHGDLLQKEDFSDSHAADTWRQDTGGSGARTWYVDQGVLNQWSADGLLHSIFTGDETWADYAFSARVRIAQNEKDGRAGLIFRASKDGFALFRLHRDKGVVQLAHHSSDPFGWEVLAERHLPEPVKSGCWYRMEVQSIGRRVRCFIDDVPVLEAVLDLSPNGGVGFYSVDAQASFDDVSVHRLQADSDARTPEATVNSYWFNADFQRGSDFWGAFKGDSSAPPWPTVTGACLQLDPQLQEARNLLLRYEVFDSQVAVKASCAEGTIGIILRDDGKRRYVCGVDTNTGRVFLRLDDGTRQQVLAEKTELRIRDSIHLVPGARMPLFYLVTQQQGRDLRLRVILIGTPDLRTLLAEDDQQPDAKAQIRFGVLTQVDVQAEDATLTSGHLGFYTDRARVLFHSMQVSDDGEE